MLEKDIFLIEEVSNLVKDDIIEFYNELVGSIQLDHDKSEDSVYFLIFLILITPLMMEFVKQINKSNEIMMEFDEAKIKSEFKQRLKEDKFKLGEKFYEFIRIFNK